MPQSILVFDSGVGGLSILSEIQKQLPDHNYYYLFDNVRLPYGTLAEATLISGAVDLITAVVRKLEPDLIVIACNTASTLILDELRRHVDIPVVGVVPAIKPAAIMSQTKHIGVLATPGTIAREYIQSLINQYASKCTVSLFAVNELVEIAERKLEAKTVAGADIETVFSKVHLNDIDVLVLGCTHFPLLKEEIQQYVGEKITLVDSGEAIANRVKTLLNQKMKSETVKGVTQAWHTTMMINENLTVNLEKRGFKKISPIKELLG
ncbi:glutamate racemase [Parashewanella curva]|uniref:Glutamate racemase n=1 Tax=Parashewanella curva TaxID=2338552 RepID=A0A3L8PSB5_9GAMM|nr:glutamate racemase [Parashewanella curva]RLV58285.1 glutamate racemase [Parashewanella curva]